MKKNLRFRVWIFALCGFLLSISVFASGENTVYVCDAGSNSNSGTTVNTAVKTLSKAIEKLGDGGGKIVVCGDLTLTDKQTYIETPDGKAVTVTGEGYDGKVIVDQNTDSTTNALLHCLTPTTLEHLIIDYIGSGTLELYAGPSLTIGSNVNTQNNGTAFTENKVVIRGGVRTAGCNTSRININSGTWGYVSGGNNKYVVANSTLTLGGTTKILSFIQAGGTNQKVSNSTISIADISVPKLFAGGYGTAQTGSCNVTIHNADIGAIYDVRSPGSGSSINRTVSINIADASIPTIDFSSVPPKGTVSLNVTDGGISRLDSAFADFDDVHIDGDTILYIGRFTSPANSLYVGTGASIILDEHFNDVLPSFTGAGSVTIAPIPITDLDTNYQGSLLLTHNRVAAVADGKYRSAQGSAGYENYIVVLYNAGTAAIYDMDSTTPNVPVGVVDLESFCISVNGNKNYTNHCNSAVFGDEKWDENDPLPLLYVTTGKSYNADEKGYIARCSVERFTYDTVNGWRTQTVQTIIYNDNDYCADTYAPADRLTYDADTNTFPYPDRPDLGFVNTNHYERIGWGWPTWFVDSCPTSETDGYIYTFRARFQSTLTGEAEDQSRYGITDYETDNEFIITKFELPDLPASEAEFGREVTLTPVDIRDQFTTEFALYYTQGGTMYQNNIYFMCGHGDMEHGFKDGMNVFNVKDKKVIAKVDLSTATCGTEEMQGALVYDGRLVINTNLFHLYQLDYVESDWLVTQEATEFSDGTEVKVDCVSGQIRDSRAISYT